MRHGELTIITSDSAEASMVHSCRLGSDAEKAGLPTLIVNCALSPKRFKEHFNANHQPKAKPELFLHSSVKGNLASEADAIDQMVYEGKVGLVIIVGWEWTSSSWRRKQRLLHYLRELMAERDVAVVVYSHCHNNPKPGHVDKGGVGKLALMSMFVAEIEMSEELESSCPKPPPLVFKNIAEEQAAERSARELISKINGLGERVEEAPREPKYSTGGEVCT